MDPTIFLFLLQDGLTNGAIYALLGFALVLIFAVTRIIFIPQGEFVAYGALTYALLSAGKVPGTIYLTLGCGIIACLFELWSERRRFNLRRLARLACLYLGVPVLALLAARTFVGHDLGALGNVLLTLAIIAPIGPAVYRIAFQPLAEASVLTLFIAAVGVHLALLGLGLVFFGAEGQRAAAMSDLRLTLGPLLVSGQSIAVYLVTLGLIVALWAFFEHTLPGKALRATAVNRIGARLVGIRTALSGSIAFALAAMIGAISGILIVPVTTVYYDTGFLIGLKGFVAAIIGGLASYPITAAAAILVGVVEAFSSFWASSFKEIIVFTLILPVLVWRSFGGSPAEEEE